MEPCSVKCQTRVLSLCLAKCGVDVIGQQKCKEDFNNCLEVCRAKIKKEKKQEWGYGPRTPLLAWHQYQESRPSRLHSLYLLYAWSPYHSSSIRFQCINTPTRNNLYMNWQPMFAKYPWRKNERGRKTMNAAGHVTTCDTNFSTVVGKRIIFDWSEREAIAGRYINSAYPRCKNLSHLPVT